MPALINQILEVLGAVSALATALSHVLPKGSPVARFFDRVGVSTARHE